MMPGYQPCYNLLGCTLQYAKLKQSDNGLCSTHLSSENCSEHDACQTFLKRPQPIIDKNPKRTWNDWIKEAFEQNVSLSATGYFRGLYLMMYYSTEYHIMFQCLLSMDIGCSINPAVDIGQIEGAFVQGIGLYTMEELKYSPEGVLYAQSPDQYKIPAVCGIPEQFSASLLSSSQNPYAIYASKGIGEAGVFLGCSLCFALRDAVTRFQNDTGLKKPFALDSPLTAEQIRASCADAFTEMMTDNESASSTPRALSV